MKTIISYVTLVLTVFFCYGFSGLSNDGEQLIIFHNESPKIVNLKKHEVKVVKINAQLSSIYALSGDGNRILFHYSDAHNIGTFYLYDIISDTGQTILQNIYKDNKPAYINYMHPQLKGRYLAYQKDSYGDNGKTEIIINDLEAQKVVFTDNNNTGVSCWGNKKDDLYYLRKDNVNTFSLYRYSLTHKIKKKLFRLSSYKPVVVLVAPGDDKFIVYGSDIACVYDLSGNLLTRINGGVAYSWSPNGSNFVYNVNQKEVLMYSLADKKSRVILSDAYKYTVIGWSKMLNKIVYLKDGKSFWQIDPYTLKTEKIIK